jgi:hypothetical protein
MPGGVLYSGQLPDANDHAVYVAPEVSAPVEIRQVIAFNATTPPVTGVASSTLMFLRSHLRGRPAAKAAGRVARGHRAGSGRRSPQSLPAVA